MLLKYRSSASGRSETPVSHFLVGQHDSGVSWLSPGTTEQSVFGFGDHVKVRGVSRFAGGTIAVALPWDG